jgi:hypothetical protein
MDQNLLAWLEAVIAERARILTRIGPVKREPNVEAERAAVYRGAAALLEWECFSAKVVDAKEGKP